MLLNFSAVGHEDCDMLQISICLIQPLKTINVRERDRDDFDRLQISIYLVQTLKTINIPARGIPCNQGT